jgi:hypothetical protein
MQQLCVEEHKAQQSEGHSIQSQGPQGEEKGEGKGCEWQQGMGKAMSRGLGCTVRRRERFWGGGSGETEKGKKSRWFLLRATLVDEGTEVAAR